MVDSSKPVFELSLSKGRPNNFVFLELFETAEDGGNLPPLGVWTLWSLWIHSMLLC